jgi:hypothetical protein
VKASCSPKLICREKRLILAFPVDSHVRWGSVIGFIVPGTDCDSGRLVRSVMGKNKRLAKLRSNIMADDKK